MNRCGAPVSGPHSSVLARLASGAFYEPISPLTFYEIIKLDPHAKSLKRFFTVIPVETEIQFLKGSLILDSRCPSLRGQVSRRPRFAAAHVDGYKTLWDDRDYHFPDIRYHLSPEWAKDYKGIALRQVERTDFIRTKNVVKRILGAF